MLESITNIKPAFVNPLTNQPKLIECIRVDGATDEGLPHQEIQFWWPTKTHSSYPSDI